MLRALTPPARAVLVAILVAGTLTLLAWGRWIQADDATTARDEHRMSLTLLPLVLGALASLGVALGDALARRTLGVALLLLDAAIVVAAVRIDWFRFVEVEGTFEFNLLWVTMLLAGAGLLAYRPARRTADAPGDRPRDNRWPLRLVGHTAVAVVVVLVAFSVGAGLVESTTCRDADECGVAVLGGLALAAGALLASVLGSAVWEVALARRRSG